MKNKLILLSVFLIIAIFGFGFSADAQTSTQTLIAQLQAQIAELTAQVQAMLAEQSSTQAWCHNFNTNLKVGNSGAEVSALFTALKKDGYIAPVDAVGNSFDNYANLAVISFQEKYASEILTPNGLTEGTGFVGPSTRAKLNALYGCSTTPSCSNLYWFDNVSSTPCQSQKQFCGAYMYYGLHTFKDKQECINSFNVARGNCTQNWQCGWGPCKNGYQSQIAIDSNNCGLSQSESLGDPIACPALAKACTVQTSVSACADSDGGINYFVAGKASVSANGFSGSAQSLSDECQGKALKEAYCFNGSIGSTNFTCPNACQSGACVQ